MGESWRLFVAIMAGAEARRTLAAMQQSCRRASLPLRPADPLGAHLTLKFLGANAPGLVAGLGTALREVATQHRPFLLLTGLPGAFPDLRQPRILWLGLTGARDQLLALQGATDVALTRFGFPREARPFRPHLTLGRLPEGVPPLAAEQLAAMLGPEGAIPAPFPVASLCLLRSELRAGGGRYTTLIEIPLGGRGVSDDDSHVE